jgi:hypothetical protein
LPCDIVSLGYIAGYQKMIASHKSYGVDPSFPYIMSRKIQMRIRYPNQLHLTPRPQKLRNPVALNLESSFGSG